MKVFVALASLLVLAAAAPSTFLLQSPHLYAAPAPILSQYHAQDELGQYSYGYSGGLSAKAETRSFDGVTRGSYSYIDADNLLQTVSYSADALNGFRVAATNLPVAPVDTNVAPVDTNEAPVDTNEAPVFDGVAPEPVEDTPEVAQAKVEHFAAVEEAKLRNVQAEKEEAVELKSAIPIATHVQYVAAATPIAHYQPASYAYATHELRSAPYAYAAPTFVRTAPFITAPQVSLKTTEVPAATASVSYTTPIVKSVDYPAHFTYNFQSPAYAYNYGAPLVTAPYHYAAPTVLAARSALPTIEAALPEPVQDTAEVAKAKEEHLAAVEEVKARNASA